MFFFCTNKISAQSPELVIDIFNPNLQFLEYLVKTEIDSLRKIQGLQKLYNDSVCYLAAKDQGQYLMDYDEISHFQIDNSLKNSPQDRVNFYGATGFKAGENIVKIYIGLPFLYPLGTENPKRIMVNTYKETAKFIALAWKNSAEHYINILSEEFDVTGVSAILNEDDRSLICVQVFAEVDTSYTFQTFNSMFPYNNEFINSKTPPLSLLSAGANSELSNQWGLEYPDDNIDSDSSEILSKILFNCFIIYRKNDVYLNLGPYDSAIRLFDSESDGIALEKIPVKDYECIEIADPTGKNIENNPLRGIITKPLYRDKLLKKNLLLSKKKGEQKQLIPFVGTLPDYHLDSFETNIIVIKNGKIWKTIQTHHLCGEMQEFNISVPLYTGGFSITDDFPCPFITASNNNTTGSLPEESVYNNNLFSDSGIINRAVLEYNQLFEKYLASCRNSDNNCSADNFFGRMDTIQQSLFHWYLEEKFDYEIIHSLPAIIIDKTGSPERFQPFAKLYFDRLMFSYINIPDVISDSSLFEVFTTLRNFRNPLPEVQYNYYALYSRTMDNTVYEPITPGNMREIADIMNRANEEIPVEYLKSLALFYHMRHVRDNYREDYINLRRIYKSLEFIYHYYSQKEINPETRVSLARYFIMFRMYQFAYQILLPAIHGDSYNNEVYIQYLKLFYSGMIHDKNSVDYYAPLIQAANLLKDEEWIGLFEGPCRINMQHLNYKPLHRLYCAKKRNHIKSLLSD